MAVTYFLKSVDIAKELGFKYHLRFIVIIFTVKVRVYSLNEELQPARRETVLTFVVSYHGFHYYSSVYHKNNKCSWRVNRDCNQYLTKLLDMFAGSQTPLKRSKNDFCFLSPDLKLLQNGR